MTTKLIPCLAAAALVLAACGDDDDAPNVSADTADAPSVEISSPADGATVTSPVTVEMVASSFEIEPAGEVRDGAGHFHLLVDTDCLDPGTTIPSDDQHQHFGKAQTTAELELEPGEHTICLQVGDGVHTALELTDTITITVEES